MPISLVQPLIMDLRGLGRNAAPSHPLHCTAMVHLLPMKVVDLSL